MLRIELDFATMVVMKPKPRRVITKDADITPEKEAAFRAAIQTLKNAKPHHKRGKRLPGSTVMGAKEEAK